MMKNPTFTKLYIKVSLFTLDDIVYMYKLNAHNKESGKSGHFTKRDLFQGITSLRLLTWFISSLGPGVVNIE